MPPKYYAATFRDAQFNCPHCQVFAVQYWAQLYFSLTGGYTAYPGAFVCKCGHCGELSLWHNKRTVVPDSAPVPMPHDDLPKSCEAEYEEARSIFSRSPRASAALLRLVVQKLMGELGQKGKNINDDIATLVKQGLPTEIQQALDYCRVVGNQAVHPGEIQLNDTPGMAEALFNMINYIVDDQISRPKRVQELYGKLPEEARIAIEKRDADTRSPTLSVNKPNEHSSK